MVLRWLTTAVKVFSASLWYARCHPSEIAFYLETITETITGNIWPLFWHFSIIISFKNIDALAEELCVAGILINGNKVSTGVWEGDIDCSRVFNHEETPQFINYGVDGTAQGLVYTGKGESCKQMLQENWESVSICWSICTPQFINYGVDGTAQGLAYTGKGESCKQMLQENWESVSICWSICFPGKYIWEWRYPEKKFYIMHCIISILLLALIVLNPFMIFFTYTTSTWTFIRFHQKF